MLEVVEQQEKLLVTQVIDESLAQRASARISDTERLGNRGGNEMHVTYRGEGNEADTVREMTAYLYRDAQGQTGFTDPAGAGEREQAYVRTVEVPANGRHVPRAAEQGSQGSGQMMRSIAVCGMESGEGHLTARCGSESGALLCGEVQSISKQAYGLSA